jgi:ferrochelatase
MRYLNTAQYTHGDADRTAVLLVNLGTPQAPTAPAVRRYLREFLSDPRVVEIPRPLWWLLLNAVILPLRPRRSAAKYAAIWSAEGSPLLTNSEQQARLVAAEVARRGLDFEVALAMRYGEPSIGAVLQRLRMARVRRLFVLPLYPQYSAATTGSALDGVFHVLERCRDMPEARWVRGFHDEAGYIEALRDSVKAYWDANGWPDRLVMSFHGLPQRNLMLGDPYHCECQKTARLLAESLGLQPDEYVVSFQSRFGRAQWLQPYTAATLRELGRARLRRVDVVCPGFVADCLETLEEISLEGRREFLTAGGQQLHYIPCLNDSPAFIRTLVDLIERHTQGWPIAAAARAERERQALEGAQLARRMGAAR